MTSTLEPATLEAAALERSAPTGGRTASWRWIPLADRSISAWLFIGLIVSTVFAGQTQLMGFPVAPNRVFLVLTLLAVLHERSYRLRERARRWRGPGAVHLAMIGTVLWATGSAIAAGTLQTGFGQFALLDRLVLPFGALVLAPLVFRTDRSRDLLLKTLILIGIYLGVTAYLEVIGPQSLVWPRFIMDPTQGIHYGRARGPFMSAEPDGLVMITAAFAGWYGLTRLRYEWKLISLASIGISLLGALLTQTRSIWLGFAVALIVVAVRDGRLRGWLPVVGLSIAVGLLGALAAFPGLKEQLDGRAQEQGSLYDRASTNAAAVRMVEQHPVFGVGWVRFVDLNQEYVRQADDIPIGFTRIETHNVVLGRAAELGLPGVTLWLICVWLGPGRAILAARPGAPSRSGAAARSGARTSSRRFRGPVQRVLGPGEPTGWWTVATGTTVAWAVTLMVSPVPYPLPNLLVFALAGLVLSQSRPHHTP